jgi:hypothetical protein
MILLFKTFNFHTICKIAVLHYKTHQTLKTWEEFSIPSEKLKFVCLSFKEDPEFPQKGFRKHQNVFNIEKNTQFDVFSVSS